MPEGGGYLIFEEHMEKLGQGVVDRIDNVIQMDSVLKRLGSINLDVQLEAHSIAFREIRDLVKAIYVEVTGSDPWKDTE